MPKKLSKKLWEKLKKEYPKVVNQDPNILSVKVDEKNNRIIIETITGQFIMTRENFKLIPTKK